jgi:hypothetical protein
MPDEASQFRPGRSREAQWGFSKKLRNPHRGSALVDYMREEKAALVFAKHCSRVLLALQILKETLQIVP